MSELGVDMRVLDLHYSLKLIEIMNPVNTVVYPIFIEGFPVFLLFRRFESYFLQMYDR